MADFAKSAAKNLFKGIVKRAQKTEISAFF
jgi:hypothetical protein